MSKTPGQQFYDEQLGYIYAGDVDGLIDNHYHEDALCLYKKRQRSTNWKSDVKKLSTIFQERIHHTEEFWLSGLVGAHCPT